MTKGERDEAVRSYDDLVSFVDRVGECYLFKKGRHPRLWDMVKESDTTKRRGLLLAWSEAAHLRKELFLTVDETGGLMVVSRWKVPELIRAGSRTALSRGEERLLGVLDHPMPTPELRKVARMPEKSFEKSLIGLRSKFRIALVGVKEEFGTRHVNLYDRLEKWYLS